MKTIDVWLAALALAGAACGGIAVVDGAGAGGSGGAAVTTSVTSSSGVTSSSSGGPCFDLENQLIDRLAQAQGCDPLINAIQCSGLTQAFDLCGCTVVANDFKLDETQAALAAYEAWVAQGCGPYDCDTCPPPPDAFWYCDPDANSCTPE